jgi:hypothetical protein
VFIKRVRIVPVINIPSKRSAKSSTINIFPIISSNRYPCLTTPNCNITIAKDITKKKTAIRFSFSNATDLWWLISIRIKAVSIIIVIGAIR